MRSDCSTYNALVANMACGDERAAAMLYDEFSPMLFGVALRILGEHADAEEVVVDAFAQAWKHAGKYRPELASVRSWLSMITRTRALDFMRARTRRIRVVAEVTRQQGDEPQAVSAGVVVASEQLEAEDRAAALTSALGALSAPQRLVIEMSFFAGLTHLEIAERIGEPLGTVKTRIRLGIHHLRNALGELACLGMQVREPRLNRFAQ